MKNDSSLQKRSLYYESILRIAALEQLSRTYIYNLQSMLGEYGVLILLW